MDINDIEAGEYQLIEQRWDEPTSEPGQPFTFRRHRKGDRLTLSEADARRLVVAGAAVRPGEMERRAAAIALRDYKALLAQVPDELRAELEAQHAAEQEGALAPTPPQLPAPELPARAENKPAWVAWHVAQGMPRADAEKLSKDELIAAAHPGLAES